MVNPVYQYDKALRKAARLLISHLSPEQIEEFTRTEGYWTVVGPKTGHKYRFYYGEYRQSVYDEGDRRIDTTCVFAGESHGHGMPPGDQALGLMLALLADEGRYLSISGSYGHY